MSSGDDETSDQDSSSTDYESKSASARDGHSKEPQQSAIAIYRQELKAKNEVLEELEALLLDALRHENCDKLVACFEHIFQKQVNLYYEDITPSLSNGTPFIVDGDMLLIHAIADANYSKCLGGQLLHLIYLCERRLRFFTQKDGAFQIIFFRKWCEVWKEFPEIQLARTVLLIHFKHNLKCNVYEFNSVWDLKFMQHLDVSRPPFILMDFDVDHFPESQSVRLVFFAHILLTLSSSMMCIDINGLKLDVSTLIAFNATPKLPLKFAIRRNFRRLVHYIETLVVECKQKPAVSLVNESSLLTAPSLENFIAVSSAASLLMKNASLDLVRIYLVYCAVKKVLPLSSRGFCGLLSTPKELKSFMFMLHKEINTALHEAVGCGFEMTHVADVWQGNLFSSILMVLSTCDSAETSDVWSNEVSCYYQELVLETCRQAETSVAAFPVLTKFTEWLRELKTANNLVKVGLEQEGCYEIFPVSCSVVEKFCHDSLQSVHFTESERTSLYDFRNKNSEFDELRHYHSRRPLTDEIDRTHDSWNKEKSADPRVQKRIDRNNHLFIRFLERYGMNMEGNTLTRRAIVCEQNKKSDGNGSQKKGKASKPSQKSQKKEKVSKKKQEIININNKAKDKKKEEDDKEQIKLFRTVFKEMMFASRYSQALSMVDELLQRLKLPQSKCEILVNKAEVYSKLWAEVCTAGCKQDLTYAKKLFLTVKAVLQSVSKENITLSDKHRSKISDCLVELGCDEVARKSGLPVHNAKKDLTVGMSWVEFQLQHLGPELDRNNDGVPDSRVEGFIPDEWQRSLFDAVDKKQSALVVAPTSSGKTYASYYCMERVLRESDDGIVVYVSPTKALVNQVHATLYARFKGKEMPAGKIACGVFTRDYQFRALDCQILITVPQCLELLLLSPRRHDWVARLRYVILDEIHCLAGQAGGIAWERCLLMIRCPFLALSATVGQPEKFQQWLQRVEHFKAKRDAVDGISRPDKSYKVLLVEYSERHSDLTKYIYMQGEFKHVHPYAFVDPIVAAGEHGIPKHVTLSPYETLQLYKAMSAVDRKLDIPEPDVYFSSSENGFLTRALVRKYEKVLKRKLEIWARDDVDKYTEVIDEHLSHQLHVPPESALKEEVQEQCTEIAMALKREEMLPAIVFSYNREVIEVACIDLTGECRKLASTQKPLQRQTKFEKREERKAQEQLENIPKSFKVKSLELLKGQGHFRTAGKVDSRDLKFVELKLLREGFKSDTEFIEGLREGIGYHHGGLTRTARSAVEMMFRLNVLNVVYATGTLALGIHMPCRTVVLGGDSHYISSLEYHQMSGRAGRRGYDVSGNVVFMGIGERKIKTLITNNFPAMKGNFPLSVGTVLRLLLLVTRVTSRGAQSPAVTQDAISRVLTLLNCSMVYEDCPEMKQQMKYFFAFSTLLLMLQGFIDDHGSPQMLSSIVTHLHYHEPGNLAFVFLFRTGALRELCRVERNGVVSKQTQLDLVLVLAYLFGCIPLHSSMTKVKPKNSIVKLPKMPTHIRKVLREYNKQVKFVFYKYFKSASRHCEETMGSDNKLPLSGVEFSSPVAKLEENTFEGRLAARSGTGTVCSVFAALSGNTDDDLYSETELVSNIRPQVFTDMKVVPVIDLETTLNAYVWDFYNHGIVSAIRKDNKLRPGAEFEKLKDFLLVLKAITVTLEELEPCNPQDPVVKTFRTVTDTFTKLFNIGFGIRGK